MALLEIIATNISSALAAAKAGADRLELCENLAAGGTTPSAGFVQQALLLTGIPCFPMLRPRGGDFMYSATELDVMRFDLQVFLKLGCPGVVFGMLNEKGEVNFPILKEFVQLAGDMEVTFHRAFDRVVNAEDALEAIISAGCKRILSSGLKPKAIDGAEKIAALIKQADGRIIIMPGSGIRANNILEIKERTGAVGFHASASVIKTLPTHNFNAEMGDKNEIAFVDEGEVREMKKLL